MKKKRTKELSGAILIAIILSSVNAFGYCEAEEGCTASVSFTPSNPTSCSKTVQWTDENDGEDGCSGKTYDANGKVDGWYAYDSIWEGTQSGTINSGKGLYKVTYSQDTNSCTKCSQPMDNYLGCFTDEYDGSSGSSSGDCVIDPGAPYEDAHFVKCDY